MNSSRIVAVMALLLILRERTTLGQNTPPSSAQNPTQSASAPVEVYVFGEQPVSTATEQTVRQKDLELRPTATPVDILTSSVPGLYTVQHQGGGKADEYFIRGFDADHGTDFAIFVDGIPVNLPNNAHGQGYADIHWLIPEIVDHIDVTKGPYFVQYGDFATAGAVNIITKRRPADSQRLRRLDRVEGGRGLETRRHAE